jgi:hypothetical protein
MMRSALNMHSRIHLAGETHYFDDLRVKLGSRDAHALSAAQAEFALDYFCALSHRPYGHHGDPHRGRISKHDLKSLATDYGGTLDDYFHAYCVLEARAQGKRIAGEKTPRHVFRIDEIFAAFPHAKVICMSRDPRAVVASYRDWRNQGGFDFENDPGHREALEADHARARQSYHPATISMLWRAQSNAALSASARHGAQRVRLQRYEDVVADPRTTFATIAEWLGLEFESAMLQVPMHNSSYSRFNENQGIKAEAVERWRSKLNVHEIRLVERTCGGAMRKLGYASGAGGWLSLRELSLWLTWPFAVIRALHVNRARSGNLLQYVWRRVRLAFGA